MGSCAGGVALVTGCSRAAELSTERHVGEIAYRRSFLHTLGRAARSLDGSRVVGVARMPADLDAVVE